MIRSNVRFSLQMIEELQNLSQRKRQGRKISRTDLKTAAGLNSGSITEFTRFLQPYQAESEKISPESPLQASIQSVAAPIGHSTVQAQHHHQRSSASQSPVTDRHPAQEGRRSSNRSQTEISSVHRADLEYQIRLPIRGEARDTGSFASIDETSGPGSSEEVHPSHLISRYTTEVARTGPRPAYEEVALATRHRERRGSQSTSSPRGSATAVARYGDSAQLPEDVSSRHSIDQSDHALERSRHREDTESHGAHIQPQRHPSIDNRRDPSFQTKSTNDRKESGNVSSQPGRPARFFVPAERVSPVVLAFYLGAFLDPSATLARSTYNGRDGYMITAIRALNTDELKEVMEDTQDWETEQQTKEYLKRSYRFAESYTARRREKSGKSGGGKKGQRHR